TTVAMTLSYYGMGLTQYDVAPSLKGAATDKNVAPEELSQYLTAQGFAAPVRVNGDMVMLRTLLANGIPVIVEQWLERSDDVLTGHYRLVRGYDQNAGVFIVNDSYTGPSLRYSEADFDRWWRAFNRLYIPVYPPEQEPLVRSIVGEAVWSPEAMWAAAAQKADQELNSQPDLYGWFNLGTARLRLNNAQGAMEAYDKAIAYGVPVRMLWYQFGPLEALNATGQYERTLQFSQPYVGLAIEEVHYYRGWALEAMGRDAEALAEYRAALSFNKNFVPAAAGVKRTGG
ncbi:MAG: C39 family peptidase, partial [Ardenticatenales bacterium]|nr:C39 family peptidase [Ardenticatenales bacterium]